MTSKVRLAQARQPPRVTGSTYTMGNRPSGRTVRRCDEMSRRVDESSTWTPWSSRSRASRLVTALSTALAATMTLAFGYSCNRPGRSPTPPSSGTPGTGSRAGALSSTKPTTS